MFVFRSKHVALQAEYDRLLQFYNQQSEENSNLRENYAGLEEAANRNLKELRETRCKFDDAWDRLSDANDRLDTMNEWVGEFAVKYNMPLQALARDMQAIKDGWDQGVGVSPWEEDET